ncbi:uncharacterized protein LOC129753848 [Uranotaenia lowii]|uniref:uncharacterized protein LOC129753848 n=1 Tax=Uranotaenia lowii TaxID=190385 RepID=UPI0024797A38|nr:uncharacterized protein LOC129753848 [Uranotaenia lowii]
MNRQLKDLFDVVQLSSITGNVAPSSDHVVAYCTDVPELINRIKRSRPPVDDFVVKIGIDGGRSFFKITLSVISPQMEHLAGFKDGGVKKLFIIALSPNLAEKYDNISPVWTKLLKLHELEYLVAGDLKIINIIIGIMAHSSKNPCPYCEALKSELGVANGTARTKGSINENCTRKKKLNGKNFASCVNAPLVSGSDEDKIVNLCPPPPLHITLGIINTIFKSLEKKAPDWVDLWVEQAQVRHQQMTYGFTGRACHALLDATNCLADNPELSDYVTVLNNFKNVYAKCFSFKLEHGFEEAIADFASSWEKLNLPFTSKYHITKYHVADFCREAGRGLGLHNEQASESVHADFDVIWQRYKAPKSSKVYNDHLLNSLIDYNSNHMC